VELLSLYDQGLGFLCRFTYPDPFVRFWSQTAPLLRRTSLYKSGAAVQVLRVQLSESAGILDGGCRLGTTAPPNEWALVARGTSDAAPVSVTSVDSDEDDGTASTPSADDANGPPRGKVRRKGERSREATGKGAGATDESSDEEVEEITDDASTSEHSLPPGSAGGPRGDGGVAREPARSEQPDGSGTRTGSSNSGVVGGMLAALFSRRQAQPAILMPPPASRPAGGRSAGTGPALLPKSAIDTMPSAPASGRSGRGSGLPTGTRALDGTGYRVSNLMQEWERTAMQRERQMQWLCDAHMAGIVRTLGRQALGLSEQVWPSQIAPLACIVQNVSTPMHSAASVCDTLVNLTLAVMRGAVGAVGTYRAVARVCCRARSPTTADVWRQPLPRRLRQGQYAAQHEVRKRGRGKYWRSSVHFARSVSVLHFPLHEPEHPHGR